MTLPIAVVCLTGGWGRGFFGRRCINEALCHFFGLYGRLLSRGGLLQGGRDSSDFSGARVGFLAVTVGRSPLLVGPLNHDYEVTDRPQIEDVPLVLWHLDEDHRQGFFGPGGDHSGHIEWRQSLNLQAGFDVARPTSTGTVLSTALKIFCSERAPTTYCSTASSLFRESYVDITDTEGRFSFQDFISQISDCNKFNEFSFNH
jgi:hypothetical protein